MGSAQYEHRRAQESGRRICHVPTEDRTMFRTFAFQPTCRRQVGWHVQHLAGVLIARRRVAIELLLLQTGGEARTLHTGTISTEKVYL
jgi:hypothetical protein